MYKQDEYVPMQTLEAPLVLATCRKPRRRMLGKCLVWREMSRPVVETQVAGVMGDGRSVGTLLDVPADKFIGLIG